jgi:hypothetical protein
LGGEFYFPSTGELAYVARGKVQAGLLLENDSYETIWNTHSKNSELSNVVYLKTGDTILASAPTPNCLPILDVTQIEKENSQNLNLSASKEYSFFSIKRI